MVQSTLKKATFSINKRNKAKENTGSYVWSSHIARVRDRPGKVANPARGQRNREK